MKRHVLCALLLFTLTFIPQIDRAEADVWSLVGPALVKKLASLWQRGDLQFMGHSCTYSVKPKVRRWKLKFYGKMSCPGLSNLVVEKSTSSHSKAVARTVEEYVREVSRRNLVSEEAARRWLQSQ